MLRARLALYGALAFTVWGVLTAVGSASAEQAAREERAAIHERNAVVALRGYRASRKAAEAEGRKRVAAERLYAAERAKVGKIGIDLSASLDSARAVLASDSASVAQLRAALQSTTERAEHYYSSAEAALALADSLRAAFHAERSALLFSLAAADSTIATQGRAIASWKAAAECRFLLWKCPTRTQVFVGGVLLGVVVPKVVK